MKEWEKELQIYTLNPAPPKKRDLQEYIVLYLTEKDDKYLSWFLHYYECTVNDKAIGIVQDYAMYGHFLDMKQAYITGMFKALQEYDLSRNVPFIVYKEYTAMREVHEYIRTMRGLTVQSSDEYLRLRKAMRLYREYEQMTDDTTIQRIAAKLQEKPELIKELITAGIRNTQFIDFYRQYADEDSEESREEIAADGTSETEKIFFKMERAEKVMEVFESLNYRERRMVSAHLGFCMECYSTEYYDDNDLDEDGKPKRKCRPKEAFIDIAIDHGLASPDTADKTYRKALQKMKQELIKQEIS